MINCEQLREFIIMPVLEDIDLKIGIPASSIACDLLIATAAQESQVGRYIAQVEGPALGIYQMEPRTAEDIRTNFMSAQMKKWALIIDRWSVPNGLLNARADQLPGNLYWATVLARIQYYRSPRALPPSNNPTDLWPMYKAVWNTPLGEATEDQFYAACAAYTDLPKAHHLASA